MGTTKKEGFASKNLTLSELKTRGDVLSKKLLEYYRKNFGI